MQNKRTILIIDDDKDLSFLVSDLLSDNGYETMMVNSLEDAYNLLQTKKPDLILLDINLPDGLGFELCEELRKISCVPVIFASARTSEDDKVKGLDIGGDDYIAKPFSLKELLSRINSLIRRTYGAASNQEKITEKISANVSIEIDKQSQSVSKNGNKVNLSPKEYELLVYFLEKKDTALTKEQIINDVWGAFSDVEPSSLAVHVRWLREKFEEEPSEPRFIKTVWGKGYICEVWKNN